VQVFEYVPGTGFVQINGVNVTGSNNKQGMRVACGDVDGQGNDEIIVGNGCGGGGGRPTVWVLQYGTPIWCSASAVLEGFDIDVFVAAGNVMGDVKDEIVVGYGSESERPHPLVRILNGQLGIMGSFYSNDTGFQGGSTTAVGKFHGAPR
jgi:hypothetical protein